MLVLSLSVTAVAQTPEGQVDELADHATDQTGSAVADPQGYANNTTSPDWQAEQANWARDWSCDTVLAASQDGREALEDAGACPEAADPSAGQDEEEQAEDDGNRTVADADELGNDTATAVEDEAAAAEAFLNDTVEDPLNVTSHLLTFVNRTRTILERIVEIPLMGLEAAWSGATLLGQAGIAGAEAVLSGVQAVGHGAHEGVTVLLEGLEDGALAVGQAIAAIGHGLQDGAAWIGHGAKAVGHGAQDALSATGEGIARVAQATMDVVRDLVPGGDEPVSRDRSPVGDVRDRALGDGPGLPLGLDEKLRG